MTDKQGAWYVKDFADGWIKFHDPEMALREAKETGAIMKFCITDPNLSVRRKVNGG